MSNKASRVRMLQVWGTIQKGGYPSAAGLALDYGVSSKTIQRDIDCLRDQMGFPLAYDEREHGWEATGPAPDLPINQLYEGELVALFLAEQAAGALRGTPIGELLGKAVRRISVFAEESFDVKWGELSQALSFREEAAVRADAELFAKLAQAVKEQRLVEFDYQKPGERKVSQRRVQPWHLAHIQGGWYLFGWDEGREAERTFAVGRMREASLQPESFERPVGWSLEGYLKGSFGVFGGSKDKERRVLLRFSAWAASLVRERRWHESEERKELLDGGLELKLTLTSLEEVERWVLSWGSHVEVVRPVELRRRLAAVGEGLVKRYG